MSLGAPTLTAEFIGAIGVSRVDITPPVGIHARNWGAATHETAAGVHRPLTATVLTLRRTDDLHPLVLIAADLGWWKSREDEWHVRGALLQYVGNDESRLLLSLSHTHAGPNLYRGDHDKLGGPLISVYLDRLRDTLNDAVGWALAAQRPASLSWRYGRCDLAQNRDLPDPARPRFVVGWNPHVPADDTLLVGKINCAATGRVLGTVVNYACHPTTLAWENQLISPDYPGAMREVIEAATQAPCLFLQGASGDLGSAAQFQADPAEADRLGRRLGYAALSLLERWPDDLREAAGVRESGAPLGLTRVRPASRCSELRAQRITVDFPLKPMETLEALELAYHAATQRAERERLWRRRAIRQMLGDGPSISVPAWCWRLGSALLVAQPNEAYSDYQLQLRARFPSHPVIVLNVTNGYVGYLPPRSHYSRDQYSVWVTPFASGGLERLTETTTTALEQLLV